ncbi:hypothetical protein CHELA20_54381 [Hyphomicrobiales bacterium]|nr:hypothetical protein CHELA41_20548 [Hyphomicrobiales bacterium]CAH1686150.1 hypothetical protein CHELA20_54381 [Hyphomicrobiales bacterium]
MGERADLGERAGPARPAARAGVALLAAAHRVWACRPAAVARRGVRQGAAQARQVGRTGPAPAVLGGGAPPARAFLVAVAAVVCQVARQAPALALRDDWGSVPGSVPGLAPGRVLGVADVHVPPVPAGALPVGERPLVVAQAVALRGGRPRGGQGGRARALRLQVGGGDHWAG